MQIPDFPDKKCLQHYITLIQFYVGRYRINVASVTKTHTVGKYFIPTAECYKSKYVAKIYNKQSYNLEAR